MKTTILSLALLFAMGAQGQQETHTPIQPPNCNNDGQVYCMWEGAYLLPGALQSPQPGLPYCDDLKANDPSECVLHRDEARNHRKAEKDLERIGLQAVNDLSTCGDKLDHVRKVIENKQKQLQAKP